MFRCACVAGAVFFSFNRTRVFFAVKIGGAEVLEVHTGEQDRQDSPLKHSESA